jgi:hypothetical protein
MPVRAAWLGGHAARPMDSLTDGVYFVVRGMCARTWDGKVGVIPGMLSCRPSDELVHLLHLRRCRRQPTKALQGYDDWQSPTVMCTCIPLTAPPSPHTHTASRRTLACAAQHECRVGVGGPSAPATKPRLHSSHTCTGRGLPLSRTTSIRAAGPTRAWRAAATARARALPTGARRQPRTSAAPVTPRDLQQRRSTPRHSLQGGPPTALPTSARRGPEQPRRRHGRHGNTGAAAAQATPPSTPALPAGARTPARRYPDLSHAKHLVTPAAPVSTPSCRLQGSTT